MQLYKFFNKFFENIDFNLKKIKSKILKNIYKIKILKF